MNKLSLNIKYYTDYERGFLIMAYLFMITDNLKKAEEEEAIDKKASENKD